MRTVLPKIGVFIALIADALWIVLSRYALIDFAIPIAGTKIILRDGSWKAAQGCRSYDTRSSVGLA